MARKTTKRSDESLIRSNWGFVRSSSKRIQVLVFALAFGVLGGSGLLAYSSFASSSPSMTGLYTCGQKYLHGGYLAQGTQNNGCVRSMQRFIIHYASQKTNFYSRCNGTTYDPSGSLSDTGDFGPLTFKYVKCYQLNTGLVVDGKPGYNTFNKMSSWCDNYNYKSNYGVPCI